MRLLATALLALAFAGPASPPLARAAESWDAYTYLPNAQVIAARNLQTMLNEIAQASNGALAIRMHLGGTLSINAANITAAVSDDVIQIADDTQYIGSVPLAGVLRLPLLADNVADYQRAYKVLFPYIEAALKTKGVTVLASYSYPLQVLWGRQKIESLADLKGLKIRVVSPEQAEFVKRYGAVAVTLGTSEVPASLDRGVVDGVITAASGAGYLWRDLLKYEYGIGTNYSDSLIIVNSSRFAALPKPLQDTVRAIATKIAAQTTADMQRAEGVLLEKMKQAGMVVTPARPADEAEAQKRMVAYWDAWAKSKNATAREALAKVRAVLGR
jgi:TRAP-type C4-dicarboxylate transport system substrate-binding protein